MRVRKKSHFTQRREIVDHLSLQIMLKVSVEVLPVPGRVSVAVFFSISTDQNGSVHLTVKAGITSASGVGMNDFSHPDQTTSFMGTLG